MSLEVIAELVELVQAKQELEALYEWLSQSPAGEGEGPDDA